MVEEDTGPFAGRSDIDALLSQERKIRNTAGAPAGFGSEERKFARNLSFRCAQLNRFANTTVNPYLNRHA
jgi:hypothetical protein